MGLRDYDRLYPIYRYLKDLELNRVYPISFKVDDGFYSTALIFNVESLGYRSPAINENWENVSKKDSVLICPDLLDLKNKIIIEYEEESKPQKRAKIIKKGHFEESERDERRDGFYKKNGFRILKIWDHDSQNFKKIVDEFLRKIFVMRGSEI